MTTQLSQSLETYFNYARSTLGTRRAARLRHQMSFLYEGVSFKGKRVLDIGGGSGRHSFFAAASAASEVVTIEPEGDGGHDSMHNEFNQWRNALDSHNVRLINTTLQDFISDGQQYDIILIQDAINHFNEPACIDLHRSEASRLLYLEMFLTISKLVITDGLLILSDCSSRNIFPWLGLSNPFDPSIEWHKHQPPEIWSDIAAQAGLHKIRLRWSTPARFGKLGLALLNNKPSAYVFTSHFVIDFRKNG
jgi:hypothetical protein